MDTRTEADAGGTVYVFVAGEIDMATADELQHALITAVGGRSATEVLVDYAGVTFCDSSGIAALDRAYAVAAERGVVFRLVGVQHSVRLVLEITGMLQALTQPDRSSAVDVADSTDAVQ
ncbi:STAS domain-containing protein [Actinoplanes sp. NPDC051633]|uniref:STAS domain-containing protein n=1 Tax=Actinoplanes sp. NPDC051633 TaxID=3155670 RepID=UPI00342D974E